MIARSRTSGAASSSRCSCCRRWRRWPLIGCGRTLARQGRLVPGWRMACFGAGIALIVATLVIAGRPHRRRAGARAHGQHVMMADLAALLLVLGLTGPLLSRCSRRAWRGACACWSTRSWPSACGRSTSTSGTCPRSTRRRSARSRARAGARQLRAVRLHDVAGAARPAAAAEVVRQRREAAVHRGRAAHRRPAGQHLPLVGQRLLSRLPAGRGELGPEPAPGPGRGRHDHDDREQHRDRGLLGGCS